MYLIYLKGTNARLQTVYITAKCIGKEAIAEMFETIATGDTSQEAMLKYFPTAFNYFENCIKGLLK